MYKTKLQELCHRNLWKLPDYSVAKQGLDHNPRFEAVVTVNGMQFRSQTTCKSSKQAENVAAKLAFDSFSLPSPPPPMPQPSLPPELPNALPFSPVSSPPPFISQFPQPSLSTSSFPQPSLPSPLGNLGARSDLGRKLSSPETPQVKLEEANKSSKVEDSIEASSNTSYNLDVKCSSAQSVQPTIQDTNQSLVANDVDKESIKLTGMQHLYKNQLQSFAQKKKLTLPVYTGERDGPPHASLFRCKVEFDGKTYESPEFFATLKDAEHAAAKVALSSLCQDGAQEDNPGLYKNLLQEMTQKGGLGLPAYSTLHSGAVHVPLFVSTVKVGGETFEGQTSKTKKLAEMSAAKVAYFSLKECEPSKSPLVESPRGQASQFVSSILQSDVSTDMEPQDRSRTPVILYPSVTTEKQPNDGGSESISTRKRGPSSSDLDFECALDTSISSHNVSQPGPPPDCSFVMNLISKLEAGKSSSSKRIVVCPRQPNMKFPEESTILPMSDDKWVAFSLSNEASK